MNYSNAKNTIPNNSICLAGYSFKPNYGDILMFAIYCKWINEKGISPYIFEPCIELISELNRKNASFIPIKEDERKLIDLCIFIGGGYCGISEYYCYDWQYKFLSKNKLLDLAEYLVRNNKRYLIMGVEVGPGLKPFAINRAVNFLENADLAILRNQQSRDYIRKYISFEPAVYPDVVFSNNASANCNAGKIALHMNSRLLHDNFFNKYFHMSVIDFLTNAKLTAITMFFDNYLTDTHSELYNNILRSYNNSGIKINSVLYKNVDTIDSVINDHDFIITNKLHCGIRALSFGKYTICIGSGPKLKRLYSYVGIQDNYLGYFFTGKKAKTTFLKNHYNKHLNGKAIELNIDTTNNSSLYKDIIDTHT